MLINLYVLSLVLGAVLLGASLFLGEKRIDADDQTRAHDDTTRASQFGQLDGVAGGDYFVRTVRSRRFWTFFVSFFGMTGLILRVCYQISLMICSNPSFFNVSGRGFPVSLSHPIFS